MPTAGVFGSKKGPVLGAETAETADLAAAKSTDKLLPTPTDGVLHGSKRLLKKTATMDTKSSYTPPATIEGVGSGLPMPLGSGLHKVATTAESTTIEGAKNFRSPQPLATAVVSHNSTNLVVKTDAAFPMVEPSTSSNTTPTSSPRSSPSPTTRAPSRTPTPSPSKAPYRPLPMPAFGVPPPTYHRAVQHNNTASVVGASTTVPAVEPREVAHARRPLDMPTVGALLHTKVSAGLAKTTRQMGADVPKGLPRTNSPGGTQPVRMHANYLPSNVNARTTASTPTSPNTGPGLHLTSPTGVALVGAAARDPKQRARSKRRASRPDPVVRSLPGNRDGAEGHGSDGGSSSSDNDEPNYRTLTTEGYIAHHRRRRRSSGKLKQQRRDRLVARDGVMPPTIGMPGGARTLGRHGALPGRQLGGNHGNQLPDAPGQMHLKNAPAASTAQRRRSSATLSTAVVQPTGDAVPYSAVFRSLDEDGDGAIDQEELRKGLRRLSAHSSTAFGIPKEEMGGL